MGLGWIFVDSEGIRGGHHLLPPRVGHHQSRRATLSWFSSNFQRGLPTEDPRTAITTSKVFSLSAYLESLMSTYLFSLQCYQISISLTFDPLSPHHQAHPFYLRRRLLCLLLICPSMAWIGHCDFPTAGYQMKGHCWSPTAIACFFFFHCLFLEALVAHHQTSHLCLVSGLSVIVAS